VITVAEIENMVSISIEICGENLALSVYESTKDTTLYIFDWKTGIRKGVRAHSKTLFLWLMTM